MDEARYRALAEARGRLLTAASQRIPLASLAQQARALSLWNGKQVAPGDEAQLALVLDLGTLDPLGGHTPGIERQARAAPPSPDSDDALMLAALRDAVFHFVLLAGPHPAGGAAAELFPAALPLRIADGNLGRNPPGLLLGMRLCWPDEDAWPNVAMGCGAFVQMDARVLERLLTGAPPSRAPVRPSQRAPDDAAVIERLIGNEANRARVERLPGVPGAAALTYRAAIDLGLCGPVPGRTPPE